MKSDLNLAVGSPKSLPSKELISDRSLLPRADCGQLIQRVVDLRKSVGDGLNDDEFTHLVQRRIMVETAGFRILCFSDGCATFTVPEQDFEQWYSEEGWINPQKMELALTVAAKYGLALCEPPDKLTYIVPSVHAHHHLELITSSETVAVAHPLYLKIRLFNTHPRNRIIWSGTGSLPPAIELMRELVGLYQ